MKSAKEERVHLLHSHVLKAAGIAFTYLKTSHGLPTEHSIKLELNETSDRLLASLALCKFCVFGNTRSGSTALILQALFSLFKQDYEPTVEVPFFR